MLIDSHTHLNFEEFKNDWPEIITQCQKENVWLINVGAQYQTSHQAVVIAEKYDGGVYAAVGLHPIHVFGSDFHPEEFDLEKYRRLIKSSKKVVAIGETGIDFYHSSENLVSQKEIFLKHLDLAQEFGLPVILHARNSRDNQQNAYQTIIAELKKRREKSPQGVIHCFGGTIEEAQEFLKLGFYIGFTGIITFDKTGKLAEVIKSLSMEKILVETDAPYLAPTPYRGTRNLPLYVKFVAEEIAKIKKIDYNIISQQSTENAIKLFNLH